MDTDMNAGFDELGAGMDDFDDLEAMFGSSDSDLGEMEDVVLTQNLEGFASCFPDWDLHPVVK